LGVLNPAALYSTAHENSVSDTPLSAFQVSPVATDA